MSRRPAPDRWPIRPGDLPSERICARDRRLARMDENPVFRFLSFRRRSGLRATHVPSELKLSAGAAPAHLPSPIVADLIMAGVSAPRVVAGMWGYAVASRERFERRAIVPLLVLGGVLPAFELGQVLGLVALAAAAQLMASRLFAPYHVLIDLAAGTSSQRAEVARSIDPARHYLRLMLLLVVTVPLAALAGLALVMVLVPLMGFTFGWLPRVETRLGWSALALAGGGALGAAWGAASRAWAERSLARMTADIDYLLRAARLRMHDRTEMRRELAGDGAQAKRPEGRS